jgi:hypothetical protein
MTKIFRNGTIAGALLATAAFVTTPAFALEGDVDVNAGDTGVQVDGSRPIIRGETSGADADVRVYAEDSDKKGPYAGDDDDGPTNDRDANVDVGEPGATVDIDD